MQVARLGICGPDAQAELDGVRIAFGDVIDVFDALQNRVSDHPMQSHVDGDRSVVRPPGAKPRCGIDRQANGRLEDDIGLIAGGCFGRMWLSHDRYPTPDDLV
jgi:hypothetical protein